MPTTSCGETGQAAIPRKRGGSLFLWLKIDLPSAQQSEKVKNEHRGLLCLENYCRVSTDGGIDVRDCYQVSLEMLRRYNHQPMDYYQLSQKSTYIFSKAVTEAQEYY